MNRTVTFPSVLSLLVLLAGCGSPAKRIETGGTSSVVTVGDVDARELKDAASAMIQSLAETGILAQAKNKPARIWIERVVNDTRSSFPTEVLVYDIREELVNSGQATVITALGESEKSRQRALEREFETGQKADFKPDFILNGRITEIARAAGNVRESTFYFRMTLTWATGDDRDGLEAWTKQESFSKQGTKNSVGF